MASGLLTAIQPSLTAFDIVEICAAASLTMQAG